MLSVEKCRGSKCANKTDSDYFFSQTRISIFISELRVATDVYEDYANIKNYMVNGEYIPVTKLTKLLDSRMMN